MVCCVRLCAGCVCDVEMMVCGYVRECVCVRVCACACGNEMLQTLHNLKSKLSDSSFKTQSAITTELFGHLKLIWSSAVHTAKQNSL